MMSTAAVTATAAAVGITMRTAVTGVEREVMNDCHVTRHVSTISHLPGFTIDPIVEIGDMCSVAVFIYMYQ
jgi:hypothetical protein